MTIADAAYVRTFCNLPDATKVPDTFLNPHLASAGRAIVEKIGVYVDTADDKAAAIKECESRLTFAYSIPFLQTLHVSDATGFQQELGTIGISYNSPDDLEMMIDQQTAKAWAAISQYIQTEDGQGGSYRMYAI